jgi:hypothetical protein
MPIAKKLKEYQIDNRLDPKCKHPKHGNQCNCWANVKKSLRISLPHLVTIFKRNSILTHIEELQEMYKKDPEKYEEVNQPNS